MQNTYCLTVCCFLSLVSASICPAAEPPRIFDREIASQPFDKEPFRQIAIPDWLEDTLGCGYTLSVMNSEQREEAASHGVTISEMGFVDPFYAYYDSQLLKRRSPHVPLERLTKDIAEYRKLGVRILGVYPPCLQGEVYETRPEWRRIATNTTEIPTIDMELDVNFAKSIGPDYWEKRKNVFDFRQDVTSFLNQGKMRTYVNDQPVTFKGPAVKVRSDHIEQVPGWIRFKTVPEAVDYPAVVTRKYGAGSVVYFAAGLDAGYYLYAYPYQRLAIKHAIEWAANERPPVRVTAPMCVHSTIMRQTKETGTRLVVHLFNDLNTTAHHALPQDDVPLREETVPIHDIAVEFGPNYRIAQVTQQPDGHELPLEPTETGVRVVVPRLDVHTLVVAELKP